jgi:RNA polymerase sigma-70 factor, ECF subfamily
MTGYHAYQASRADLLRRAGRPEEAQEAYRLALGLTDNSGERAFLEGRRAALGAP